MRWDVLSGCADPATAIRRAEALSAMAAFKGEGEDFWAAATELWLQTLLHVAALRRAPMDLVHYWALSRDPGEFLRALPGAGGEAERWGTLIRDQMTSTATKTTDTIRYMVAANLAFMLDPVLHEAVTPGPGAFSPADFVRDGGTLYLIDALMFVKGVGWCFGGRGSGVVGWCSDRVIAGLRTRQGWASGMARKLLLGHASRSEMRPGTADESLAGQQVRGSRLSGQAVPGDLGVSRRPGGGGGRTPGRRNASGSG